MICYCQEYLYWSRYHFCLFCAYNSSLSLHRHGFINEVNVPYVSHQTAEQQQMKKKQTKYMRRRRMRKRKKMFGRKKSRALTMICQAQWSKPVQCLVFCVLLAQSSFGLCIINYEESKIKQIHRKKRRATTENDNESSNYALFWFAFFSSTIETNG